MAYEFRLQDPGEGIHEAEIIEIKVAKGDRVEEGDDVLVAETDKAAVDIPSPVSGKITEIRVEEGDIVNVGDVLMVIAEKDAEEDSRAGGQEEEEEQAAGEEQRPKGGGKEEREEAAKEEPEDDKKVTEPQDQAPEEKEPKERKATEAAEKGEAKPEKTDLRKKKAEGDVLATPAVRGMARELGVDLQDLSGSGEEGRILEEDVRQAAEGGEAAEGGRSAAGERFKLRSIKRTTAKRMADAWREIPHAVHHDAIDISALERLRRDHAGEAEKRGGKLTLTPFLMKAVAGALRRYPRFNARFHADSQEVEAMEAINIGVALDTDDGLLVPVLRDVDRKSVLDLAVELTALSERLRSERPDREALKGGTFTLTNVGSIGGTGFSPIINPPQVAIFGAARASLQYMPTGDLEQAVPEVILSLPVCIAFDHRVIDGAEAARFMNAVKTMLADPQELLLRS